ncbi:hypothetical protein [Spirosoma koreense]
MDQLEHFGVIRVLLPMLTDYPFQERSQMRGNVDPLKIFFSCRRRISLQPLSEFIHTTNLSRYYPFLNRLAYQAALARSWRDRSEGAVVRFMHEQLARYVQERINEFTEEVN